MNDIDLREATHEEAVAAIKNAANPVRFKLQSLHSFNPTGVRDYYIPALWPLRGVGLDLYAYFYTFS